MNDFTRPSLHVKPGGQPVVVLPAAAWATDGAGDGKPNVVTANHKGVFAFLELLRWRHSAGT